MRRSVTRIISSRHTARQRSQIVSSPVTLSGAPCVGIAVAVRTSPRAIPTLQDTLDSVERAGFEAPQVFGEPGSVCERQWPQRLGPFKSFVAMANEMLCGSQHNWLLLCEDDVRFAIGAADCIRQYRVSPDQVLTLYVSSAQSEAARINGVAVRLSGVVHGSLAYLFHKRALRRVLASRTFRQWCKPDSVDRAICAAIDELGSAMIAPHPPLAQHTGMSSTINPRRRLDHTRVSGMVERNLGLVTLITPTGDRPESFRLCERWMARQRYTGDIQWIVVDDGHMPTQLTAGQELIRLEPMRQHSLCRNLRAALSRARGDKILVIEDDDWYGPDYVSAMAGALESADLVGECGAKYYHLPQRRWRHRDAESHASLCRTGFRRAVIPTVMECVTGTHHPSVDLRLWASWSGSMLRWRDETGDSRMCVGIKGGPGRKSRGHKPASDTVYDPHGEQLRSWIGDDAQTYLDRTSHDSTPQTDLLQRMRP